MLGILLWSTAVLFALSSAGPTCFYPDGTTSEPNHSPCNITTGASACCDPADSCTTSGLCLGRTGFTYRGTCTDRSWKSGNCPGACRADPFDKVAYSTTTALLSCDKPGTPPTNFCCNSPYRNCCTIATFIYGNTGFAFNPGMDFLQKQLITAQSQAKAEATNDTARPPANAHFINNKLSMCLTSAATIGIAVGAPLGALVIGVIGFLFWREKRNDRKEREREADGGNEGSNDNRSMSRGRAKERPQAIMMDLDPLAKDRPYYFNPGPPPKPPMESNKEENLYTKAPMSRSDTSRSETSMSGRSNTLTGRTPPPMMRTRMEKVDRRGDVNREPEGVHELI